MQLLVSVANASEAQVAFEGGADIIDAKDPTRGSLGAVRSDVLRGIITTVCNARPVSAALGDAVSAPQIEHAAREAAAEGVAYLKVGFAGISDLQQVRTILRAAISGVQEVTVGTGVIAVGYADAARAGSVLPEWIIEGAERAGAVGVLLDTAFKDGGGLFKIMNESAIAAWVALARAASLTVAIAGQLGEGEIATARALGADIIGVRGAACEGGRTGRITQERVAALARSLRLTTPPPQYA